MKHAILATLVAFTGLAPAMDFTGPSPVHQRLMQIDLDVATRHYEKLQGLLRDAKLEQMVAESGGAEASHAEQLKLARKIEIISQLSEETREEILKLGQVLEQSGVAVRSPYAGGTNQLPDPAPRATSYERPVNPAPAKQRAVVGIPGAMVPSEAAAPAVEPPPPPVLKPVQPIDPNAGAPGFPGGAPPPVPMPATPGLPVGPPTADPTLPPATSAPQR